MLKSFTVNTIFWFLLFSFLTFLFFSLQQERFKEQALKRAINLHNLGGDSVVIFLVSELLEVSEVAQYPENSIPKDVENNVVQLMTRALRKNPLNTIVQSNVSNFIDLKETSSIADAIVEREANDKKKIFKAGKDKMAKDTVQQEVSVEELKLAPKKSPRKKSPTKKSPARKLRPKKVSPTKSPKKAPIKAKK